MLGTFSNLLGTSSNTLFISFYFSAFFSIRFRSLNFLGFLGFLLRSSIVSRAPSIKSSLDDLGAIQSYADMPHYLNRNLESDWYSITCEAFSEHRHLFHIAVS